MWVVSTTSETIYRSFRRKLDMPTAKQKFIVLKNLLLHQHFDKKVAMIDTRHDTIIIIIIRY